MFSYSLTLVFYGHGSSCSYNGAVTNVVAVEAFADQYHCLIYWA